MGQRLLEGKYGGLIFKVSMTMTNLKGCFLGVLFIVGIYQPYPSLIVNWITIFIIQTSWRIYGAMVTASYFRFTVAHWEECMSAK